MRNILITGASSGLGQALAIHFANDQTCLHLLSRNQKKLASVKRICEGKHAKVEVARLDVRDRKKMKEYIDKLAKKNQLDMVIANAGISAGTANGMETDEQVYGIFETNLMGVLHTIQPAVQHFIKKKKGKILIMSSLAGYLALPGCPAYSASKAAVRFYGNALADYVKKYNVDVRVVSPGYIKTAMTKDNDFPMPFLMEPEEAAKIIELKSEYSKNPNIAFPWPMYFFTWLAGIISRRFIGPVLRLFPAKKSFRK